VRWRKNGTYVWVRAESEPYMGACNGGGCDWDFDTDWNITKSRWVQRGNYSGLRGYLINPALRAVGICLSPDFSEPELFDAAKKFIKKNAISYTKGRMDEDYQRWARPPGLPGHRALREAVRAERRQAKLLTSLGSAWALHEQHIKARFSDAAAGGNPMRQL
jgi:hypothetical protein